MDDAAERTGYRRSAGSPRGQARRLELLASVTDDLAANGLVDFSLRRAAKAAGTTHKVLLYHFASAEDLLAQAVFALRERRIANALAAMADGGGQHTLAGRVGVAWRTLRDEEPGLRRVLDQAVGLTMYDPERYAELGRGSTLQYLELLVSFCPQRWSADRKREVAQLVLATLRGFVVHRLTSDDPGGAEAGFAALARALEREEAVGD
ncbi:TetR/AcrR family transcriptional regulator [Amycolatopsis rhabdoformis]|uniref:TetR/AcrR family transcriptional regulator n=1 Tax=Amycolatopsis rhabdoformis TaxID=1448059 RepID=A0ABZ1IDH2_9PSEU|nr:TetR/AcrR family transcriptional regulator [Amycolatopsis rhabdoformis]WSE31703.1 TetR/AcrR family transcriptional regulator [Amycolatopsis rhabdoformis]